jgi:hypothetical protein
MLLAALFLPYTMNNGRENKSHETRRRRRDQPVHKVSKVPSLPFPLARYAPSSPADRHFSRWRPSSCHLTFFFVRVLCFWCSRAGNKVPVDFPTRKEFLFFPLRSSYKGNKKKKERKRTTLSGGDGLADAGTALPGVQAELLTAGDLLGLLDDLLALGEDELDVAGVGHVGVDL